MTTLPVQFVEALSARLAYTDSGKGVALVCLHDALDCPDTFAPLTGWADWGRWVCIALPGFGGSALPAPPFCGVATFARYISEAMEQLGLLRVILVGHGLGAGIASWIALHDPERVLGLCILGRSFGASPSPALQLSRRRPFQWAARYLLGERATRWRLRAKMLLPPKPERAQRLAAHLVAHRQETLALSQPLSIEEQRSLQQRLPALKTPILWVRGASENNKPDAWSEALQHATTETITSCAQYPHEEQPEQVAALLHAWLEKHQLL